MSRAVRAGNHGILRASGFAIRRVDCRLPSTTAHDGFNALLLFFNAGGFRHFAAPLARRYVRAHELLAARLDVLTISISLEMFEEAPTAPCVDALTISTNLAAFERALSDPIVGALTISTNPLVVERALPMTINPAVPLKESTCKLSLPLVASVWNVVFELV